MKTLGFIVFLFINKTYALSGVKLLSNEIKWNKFHDKVSKAVLNHPVVIDNTFTKKFSKGEASLNKQKVLVQQFSVFSQLFLIAQLMKVINAPNINEMRDGKEILCNELGVEFNNDSIEKGTYRHSSAHFEWLVDMAEELGLYYNDLGKRYLGNPNTLHFCDELSRLYGSPRDSVAIAASYAIENWAQAGFWNELIEGFEIINKKRIQNKQKPLPLAFWKFHAKLEEKHAAHTVEELKSVFLDDRITDSEDFIFYCEEMLDAINIFWKGIEKCDLVY